MADCNTISSINPSQGTTQAGRLHPALQAGFFAMEERSIADFIAYAQTLAAHLKYFNLQNQEAGDWTPFFASEPVAIMVYLSRFDPEYPEQLRKLKRELQLADNEAERRDLGITFFTTLQNELLLLAGKVDLLGDDFVPKSFFVSGKSKLTEHTNFLLNEISGSSDVFKTIAEFTFYKSWQQLMLILQAWKQKSTEQVEVLLNNFSGHQPHFTLFLTFLKLLRHTIDDMNGFTQRHLQFYYRDVLHLQPKQAQNDFVHLLIEPATHTPFELPAGTVFPAKKNKAGQNKFYISHTAQAFNNASVEQVWSSFIKDDQWYKADVSALNDSGKAFRVFRTDTSLHPYLLLAHPVLYLQSGERDIIVRFDNHVVNHLLYDFYITSEKAFIRIPDQYIGKDKITLPPGEKAIVPYDADIHKDLTFHTALPVLKMMVKKGAVPIKCKKISVHVAVRQSKHFRVSNDTGEVDTSKAFKPFGDFPNNGMSLVWGSNEFFAKAGAKLTLTLLTDAPDTKLAIQAIAAVNSAAGAHKILRDATDRKRLLIKPSFADLTDFEYLKDGRWVKIKELEKSSTHFTFKHDKPNSDLVPDELLTPQSTQGFIRFRLNHPHYAGQTFLNKFVKGAKAANVHIPEPPTIFTFDVSYEADADLLGKPSDIFVTKQIHSAQATACFVGTAFGYRPYTASGILPAKGEILIGFSQAEKDRGLHVLFQMQEGTSNPLKEAAEIRWFFLHANQWQQFSPQQLSDDTGGLQRSGIVRFTIPSVETASTMVPQPQLFWIRILVSDIDAICHIYGIHSQALKAQLFDHENSHLTFTEFTAAKTITEAFYAGGEIKSIKQPYASFGGIPAEDEGWMNRRVSERLRHKQRAITTWDYERLVLEKFPEVYKVKALNHYRYDQSQVSSLAAGYTTLIVITRSATDENPVEWKPMPGLALAASIKSYLQGLQSGHVRLQVKPPQLEEIRVSCRIKFRSNPGDDTALLKTKLQEALNRFISPWAFTDAGLNFVQKIESASFIRFIDEQPYVDFVSDLELFHDGVSVKEIIPGTDYSLFKPTPQHQITEIKENC